MDTIPFNGKNWPYKTINLEGEWVNVASELLEEQLIGEDGSPVSDEAKSIDEFIYCYVPQKKFTKADNVLTTYVFKHYYR